MRTGSGGVGGGVGGTPSLRLQTKRRRSLSATLPRTSVPVELVGRAIPASASIPPPEYTDGRVAVGLTPTIAAPSKADGAGVPASGGGAKGIRRILSFLPGSFGNLQGTPAATVTPGTGQSIVVPEGPPPRVWKRGEVQCLDYATLSDREMRRLEGRSDHRPVIGQFAVYL